jgi:thymidylate synthase, flavin-dependent
MRVRVLNKTEQPERLLCRAGRGDYYEGYVGDTTYAELMEGVNYDDADVESTASFWDESEGDAENVDWSGISDQHTLEAKTRSFVRKQASRGHWGLWEHPSLTIAVEGMSRVTMAQVTRHRHMSFDVQSMRYVDFEDLDVAVPESLTESDHATRSEGLVWDYDGAEDDRNDALQLFEKGVQNAENMYQSMLDRGVPAEDARYVLPLGAKVNVTMTGNARTMLHLLNLRQRANAQWEIRNLSNKIVDDILEDWIPYTAEWWNEKGPVQISP